MGFRIYERGRARHMQTGGHVVGKDGYPAKRAQIAGVVQPSASNPELL